MHLNASLYRRMVRSIGVHLKVNCSCLRTSLENPPDFLIIVLAMLQIQAVVSAQQNRVFNIIHGDSVTIQVEARGQVQWEKSHDSLSWEEMTGETGAGLTVVANQSAYYRAKVLEPNCEPVYSANTFVRVMLVNEPQVSIGIMRWDAWAPDTNPVSPYNQSLECMKPKKWNDLGYWPWWATVDETGNLLELNENRPEVMEQENRYAYESQVDYWAFFRYQGDNNPMNQQFQRYLESSTKPLVRFCFIASPQVYKGGISEIKNMVNYMDDPQYFTVLGGRPLIYFYLAGLKVEEVRDYFSQIRRETLMAGCKNPYIVLFNNPWEWSFDSVRGLGQDAYSEYGPKPGRSVEGSPYSLMISGLPVLWNSWAEANDHIVPSFSQQWDPRPYYEKPPSWWPEPDNQWFNPPSKEEFRQNVQNAVNFVKTHPEKCLSLTVIIKEWNGFTEGATIVPSLLNGTMYIDGLKQVIK